MMIPIELLILGLIILSLAVYLLSHFSVKIASVATAVISLLVFGVVGYAGYVDPSLFNMTSTWLGNTALSFLKEPFFSVSALGIFFTTILLFIYAMASFFNPYFIEDIKYKHAYSALWVLSLAGVVGVFFAANMLVLFFLFELIVWSTMFLVQMGKKKEAAISYFGFSMAGSVAMLFAIFYMAGLTGTLNLDVAIAGLSNTESWVVYGLLLVAGFSKLGAFPLNIWLPKAHGSAPHPFSPVLSGGLVKLGAYVSLFALVRLAPFTSEVAVMEVPWANWVIALLGSLSIIFGTLMAIRSDDAKVLLAYSSMSNAGFILVGFSILDSHALAGGLYHVLVHAIASAAAFMSIAAVAKQTHTTKISEMGGIIHKMPFTYMVYLIAIISMAGIPPMGGFISKWLIYQAALNKGMIFVTLALTFGSIGSFLYVFRPLAALFLGQELPEHKHIKEVPFLMGVPMAILSVLNLLTGTTTTFFLDKVNVVVMEFGFDPLVITGNTIEGWNAGSYLHPMLMAGVFAVGVGIAFVIFISLKKSERIGLMNTYTAGNFIYTEELLHYSADFYAPIERLYEKYVHITEDIYHKLHIKVKEFGKVMKYIFFNKLLEIFTIMVILVMMWLLLSEVVL